MSEKEFILKGIVRMEEIKPSQINPVIWLNLKTNWLPRLKAFVNGEEVKEKKVATVEDAEQIFETR